ncbi:beta-glucosidase [Treponema bryantii]|uniref:Beta-glucosidase n=1 Tax=Treponema bryantii TaxID=163 RepID=A0A1H9ERC8_9SPIR|nr:glycoside hydrolase family 3 C-terminal domain-containing protein [Treponema bryantii]SEQ28251.1 beta-glucosidase [Treponema bryantii]
MDTKIKELLSQLTLEEKAGLCSGKDFWRTKPVERLGIPSVMVSDGPSGLRTQVENGVNENDSRAAVSFPSGCATASSFDRNLLRNLGEILGEEANNYNVSTVLGPAINIKRSPLCGRNFEYLSEDPYVAGELGAAYVKGVQSKNVGTSVKHFAANNQETNRFSVSEEVDERTLREIYLPAFENCVKNSAPTTIMCSYNAINGELSSQNKWLLKDVLRDEWGFKGMVVSDWGAVYDRVKGIKADLSLEMPYSGGHTDNDIVQAVKAGTLTMEELDEAVSHVLEMVLNYTEHKQSGVFDMDKDHAESARIAEESCVLLKNDNAVLPIKASAEKVLFTGCFAENPRYGGGGSSKIKCYKMTSAVDAAREAGLGVKYVKGYNEDFVTTTAALTDEAVAAAREADTVVVFAGLPESYETEGADRTTLDMPQVQNELIEKLAAVNKNVVVVLHNGAPVAMPWVDKVAAILECYLGGENIGTAQVNLLFGKANPSGKLAETFPLRLEDTPCYLTYPGNGRTCVYSEGIFVGYRWYDSRKMPVLFPFGYGLSYTTFEYSNLKVSKSAFKDSDGVEVSITIKNTGSVEGKEVVQLYVSDKTGVEVRPEKELKGFDKVNLKPGESKEVTFKLDRRSFAFWNIDIDDWYAPSGKYIISIGASSRDIRATAEVDVTSTSKKAFTITPQTTMGDMLRNREMAAIIKPEFDQACHAVIGDLSDEEFAKLFPFTKDAMIEMTKSNPFRLNRGKNGITMEDILKQVERYNKELDK